MKKPTNPFLDSVILTYVYHLFYFHQSNKNKDKGNLTVIISLLPTSSLILYVLVYIQWKIWFIFLLEQLSKDKIPSEHSIQWTFRTPYNSVTVSNTNLKLSFSGFLYCISLIESPQNNLFLYSFTYPPIHSFYQQTCIELPLYVLSLV